MLKMAFLRLDGLRGGLLVSMASGVFSLAIVAAIRLGLGEDDANSYIFLSALTTLVGAVAAFGIPEYGQVLHSNKRSGALVVPIFSNLFVVAGLVLFFSPESHSGVVKMWHVTTLILMQVCVGAILTVSELRFRCVLLSSNHISNYIFQNATQHLSLIAVFLCVSSYAWGPVLGICILVGIVPVLWSTISTFPLKFKFTLFLFTKEQSSFYLQRLALVFIDTVLLLSARNSIHPTQYFALGVINRITSPVFIVLNIFLGRRQANILSGSLSAKAGWLPLLLVSFGIGIALIISTLVGFDSTFSTCLSIVFIRLWVILLAYECQRWLPDSPLVLVVGSAAVWGVAAWLIVLEAASLIVITSVALWLNGGVIVALTRFRMKHGEL
jgi:hypothetical protein